MKRLVIALLVAATVIVVACKQGKGDRCQIDDDCSPPLLCNKATNTCQDMVGGGIDANAPQDAPDAPLDMMPDT